MASGEEVAKIFMKDNQGYSSAEAAGGLQNGATPDGNMSHAAGQNGGATSQPLDLKDIVRNTGKKSDASTKETSANDEDASDKDAPSKDLTELDKYWKVVEDNASDFTGWTYLLQFVEQEKNMETVRKAYDAFLSHYPYCYGYWKKYADLEKDPDKAEQVFQQGVKAVALSIDMWVHYLTFATNKYKSHPDKMLILRGLFESALSAAGLDFRSDRLWQMYIKWEKEEGSLQRVTAIYDRLLANPTQLYRHHFDCLTEFINSHYPKDILSIDEFLRLRGEVVMSKSILDTADDDDPPGAPGLQEHPPGLDGPPGEDLPPGTTETASKMDDSELASLRKVILEHRRVVFEALEVEVTKRWTFEDTIRRPYFHVKPLEKSQLKNWRDYLDFEINCSCHERIVILFERCVITCALYEEFWLKYAKYQEHLGIEAVRHVLQRACNIHLPKKPHIHIAWAAYEERYGLYEEAAVVLNGLDRNMNGLVMARLRCISLERRRLNFSRVDELYKESIGKAESTEVKSFYAIKYARYLAKVTQNVDAAKTILEDALEGDKSNHKLHLQLIDLEYQKSSVDLEAMATLFSRAIAGPLATEHRVAFSQRRLEFLEDFGSNVTRVMSAYGEHQEILKELQSTKKRKLSSETQVVTDKKNRTEPTTDVTTSSTSSYAQPAAMMHSYGDMSAAYAYPQQWGAYNNAAYSYQQQGWNSYAQQYYGAHQ